MVHFNVEDCSEELLHQHSYAIKNQLVASKAPYQGLFAFSSLVLYGIRVLAEQLLGTVLDIEVDDTALR